MSHHFDEDKRGIHRALITHHDLASVVKSKRQHVWVQQVLDVIRDFEHASIGFECRVVKGIACESSRPWSKPVGSIVGIIP